MMKNEIDVFVAACKAAFLISTFVYIMILFLGSAVGLIVTLDKFIKKRIFVKEFEEEQEQIIVKMAKVKYDKEQNKLVHF